AEEAQGEQGHEGQGQEVRRLARLHHRPAEALAVARFSARRLPFGRPPGADDVDDDGTGLPTPARVKLAARRAAGLAEARDVLAHLPGPGESLHAVCTARMDLSDVVGALLTKLGPCDRLVIATLGYNERNLRTMLGWLDSAAVRTLAL